MILSGSVKFGHKNRGPRPDSIEDGTEIKTEVEAVRKIKKPGPQEYHVTWAGNGLMQN